MRSLRHWTPRYIANRLALTVNNRINPDAPWLTRAMINILDSWLRPDDFGLEFGSGRSTVWFARRVAHLTSVEHHPQWHFKVAGWLNNAGVASRVDYRLADYSQSDAPTSAYVLVTSEIPRDSLDFCLIDGVGREYCLLAVIHKIKPGGIVIVDNIECYLPRERQSSAPASRSLSQGFASDGWKQCADALSTWRGIWTSNGIWDTALWIKPSGQEESE